jgi:hypothetical protein
MLHLPVSQQFVSLVSPLLANAIPTIPTLAIFVVNIFSFIGRPTLAVKLDTKHL